jgi:hypothetical protein
VKWRKLVSGDKVDEELATATFANNGEVLALANHGEVLAATNALANYDEELATALAATKKIAVKVIKNRVDEVYTGEKSEELAAESTTLEAPPLPPPRSSRTSPPWRCTLWEPKLKSATYWSRKLTTTTLKNRLIITTKNTRAESKRIDVKVSKKKFAVKENITIKNKPAKSKKIGVEFITYKQV